MKTKTHIAFACCILLLNSASADAQKKKDTIVLLRKTSPYGAKQVVYIDNNRKSWAYSRALKKDIDPGSFKMYLEKAASKYGATISKHALPDFTRTWYPLKVLKGHYYVYFPSDAGVNNWISVNDSTVIQNTASDDIYPSVLDSVQILDNGAKINITMTDPLEGHTSLTIHIIDKGRGIAIVERPGSNIYPRYQLMVDEKKFNRFPIVINHSPDERADEYEFDKVNYRDLLKKK